MLKTRTELLQNQTRCWSSNFRDCTPRWFAASMRLTSSTFCSKKESSVKKTCTRCKPRQIRVNSFAVCCHCYTCQKTGRLSCSCIGPSVRNHISSGLLTALTSGLTHYLTVRFKWHASTNQPVTIAVQRTAYAVSKLFICSAHESEVPRNSCHGVKTALKCWLLRTMLWMKQSWQTLSLLLRMHWL